MFEAFLLRHDDGAALWQNCFSPVLFEEPTPRPIGGLSVNDASGRPLMKQADRCSCRSPSGPVLTDGSHPLGSKDH